MHENIFWSIKLYPRGELSKMYSSMFFVLFFFVIDILFKRKQDNTTEYTREYTHVHTG